ncbi:MAG TPA: metallophosphoesterase [Gemmatimonadaceae bacterium]|nr:metallophosphoesterase [Gemmatimonadaceae bacterium]
MQGSPDPRAGRRGGATSGESSAWRGPERRRPASGVLRVAAVGDFHCGVNDVGLFRETFAEANVKADVLVLTGDMTRRGELAEFKVVAGELADVKIPVVGVLGNHDYESNQIAEGIAELSSRGIHILDGDDFQLLEQVGFAGVKGYMGGFGRGTLTAFGEPETKAFVGATLAQVQGLELALRRLATPIRIVVLHYAPILATVLGEPEMIYPYLGTDRLAEPLDRYGCTVAFHGHAHSGTLTGRTTGGVPVFNVSLPLLRRESPPRSFYVHEIQLPPIAAPAAPGGTPPASAGATRGAGSAPETGAAPPNTGAD